MGYQVIFCLSIVVNYKKIFQSFSGNAEQHRPASGVSHFNYRQPIKHREFTVRNHEIFNDIVHNTILLLHKALE